MRLSVCLSVCACVCVRLFVFSFWLDFTIFSAQSSIDHCCRYLVGDSAKIMASTLLNVAHDVALIVKQKWGKRRGELERGLDAACNRGDCIASVSLSVCLSVCLSRVSRKLNCLGNCKLFCLPCYAGNGCAMRRMSDLFRIRRVCCAVQLI